MNAASPALDHARRQFTGGSGYLAACTLGLPTARSVDAIRADLDRWAAAGVSPGYYDDMVQETRRLYAGIVGVPAEQVAIGSQAASQFAVIAASVPDGARVVCVDGDFSSVVFPFLQHAHRGVSVQHVPLDRLASHIDDSTWLVAYSIVQSATGEVADVEAIRAAAAHAGARVVCDTTQAVGWYPIDASVFDATICHAYKWLCSPRGVSFLTVAPSFAEELRPIEANWYAGEDVWASCYGPVSCLASDARRFDVSPAWQAWAGALPALEMFSKLDIDEVRAYDVALGNRLCAGLGLPIDDQAIVTWPDPRGRDLERLTLAGVTASGRAGRARVSFHLWNDQSDVDRALEALRG